MEHIMLDVKMNGMSQDEFILELAQKCEKALIQVEYGKLTINALKQLNNHRKLILAVAQFEHKKMMDERNLSLS